jgi:hypothetical protein
MPESSRLESDTVTRVLLFGALLGCLGPPAAAQVRPEHALKLLLASRPDVHWDPKSGVRADFDCDGLLDEAFLGRSKGKIFVGVVRSGAAQPEVLEFGIGTASQSSICSGPVKLASESLDYDPTAKVGKVDGFVRSRRCEGLVLSGGECDSFHIFWSHKKNHLDWWRL